MISYRRIKDYFRSRFHIKPPVKGDPQLLHPRIKFAIITSASLVACTSGVTSTIYFPGIPYITTDLHAEPIVTTLTAALYMLFNGISPVIWASLSDRYHIRRFLTLIAMLIYIAACIGAIFVKNIWALVVVRCIQSIGVSCGQSIGAGYIADLYPIEQRGSAFGQYMTGLVIGPVLGGFLILTPIEWRATFWFCFAFGIMIFLLIFFFIPETFREDAKYDQKPPIITDEVIPEETPRRRRWRKKQKCVENDKKNRKCFNPFSSFALLRHLFVILPAVAAGLSFGVMFATEAILLDAFDKIYGLNSWKTGLIYIGGGLGNIAGANVGSHLSDKLLLRARRKRGGIAEAEDRLTANIWIAGLFFNPLGILLFGWTVQYHLNIWGAIIGFGIQCFGNVQCVTAVTAYLVDVLTGRGAAATALVNFVRFVCACILTIISTPMVRALGAGWTSTPFACLSLIGMGFIFIMKIWGSSIRKWSGY